MISYSFSSVWVYFLLPHVLLYHCFPESHQVSFSPSTTSVTVTHNTRVTHFRLPAPSSLALASPPEGQPWEMTLQLLPLMKPSRK